MFVFKKKRLIKVKQALENTEHGPYLNLLNVFAYGTFTSLLQNSENLPQVLFLKKNCIVL